MLLNKKISLWYFLNQIKYQLLLIICFAIFVGFLDTHPIFTNIILPLPIVAIVGTVVSLLLAFRTSQSYDRWWEARKIWGAIVNDSRTFVRLLIQFNSGTNFSEIKLFTERQIIWTYALGESLRRQTYSKKVKEFIELNNIEASNIPNALLDAHANQLKKLAKKNSLSELQLMQLNTTLNNFCASMGMCERIKNTVFPKSYSLVLHTLIYIFTFLLPFGLDDSQIVIEIVLTILLPTIFLTIEKTAILMQDPFENTPTDVPITTIAQTIEINILQMINEINIPNIQQQKLYYQM